MAENAAKTPSDIEENVNSVSDSTTVDPTAAEVQKVGSLDTILFKNSEENTKEDEVLNEPTSREAGVEGGKKGKNTNSPSDSESLARPKRTTKPTEKFVGNRLQSDQVCSV